MAASPPSSGASSGREHRPRAQPGPQIPGYRIERELGRGSFGVVFLARRESDGAAVALKVLTDTRGFDDARFELEHALLRKLHHPGLIGVYEKGRYGRLHYYAMDYCPGPTLKEQTGKQSYGPRQAAQLVIQLADAAGYAHRQGIVHRDLKPANVILAPGGPRITDFGLARATDLASSLTLSGELVGTPLYMAPEQWEGGQPASPRADVYALGAILYECLVGRPPIRGRTVVELAPKVLAGRFFPPSDYVELPSELEAVCLKALARDPAARYADGGELADALRHTLGQGPAEEPDPRRLAWTLVAVAVPALAASIFAAGLLIRPSEPASPEPPAAAAARPPTPEPPLSAEELERRALAAVDAGAPLEQVLAALDAAQAAPGADEGRLRLARLGVLVRRRQRADALRLAREADLLDPDGWGEARWLEVRALLLPAEPLDRGQLDRLWALVDALEADPDWAPVARAQRSLFGRDERAQQAAFAALEGQELSGAAGHARRVLLGSYCNSTQRYDEAEALLRAAVATHPDDTEALTLVAFVVRNRHRDTGAGNVEAAELYARIVELSEPNPPAQVLLYRARLLCELEAFAEAAACGRRRLRLGGDPKASFWLAVACLELGEIEEARAALADAFAQGEAALEFELQVLNAKLPGRAPKLYALLERR
ncbi:MAG: serine/threonine-protein kinase [Planctomycetota bacterium]